MLKELVRRVVARFGYRLEPAGEVPPIDLRAVCNNPFSLPYYSEARPILIDVPMNLGRGLRVIPLAPGTSHPMVRALTEGLRASKRDSEITAWLKSYYQAVQPGSAAEWLDLNQSESPELFSQPPWAVTMPWDVRTPDEWRTAREGFVLSENSAAGISMTISEGWHFWGPVSDEKLGIEARRLEQLADSFIARGVVRHDGLDGDVRAVVLRTVDGSWRWQVTGGEHRAAVLSALGYKQIPARILQVVNREDIGVWPGVTSGVFTRDAALKVFDLVFAGHLPRLLRRWVQAPVS
jgi:hypothetical protein